MPSLRLIRRAGEARYEAAAGFNPVLVMEGKQGGSAASIRRR